MEIQILCYLVYGKCCKVFKKKKFLFRFQTLKYFLSEFCKNLWNTNLVASESNIYYMITIEIYYEIELIFENRYSV